MSFNVYIWEFLQVSNNFHNPKGLTRTDLEDLLEDIKVYMELEQSKNAEFWKVCMKLLSFTCQRPWQVCINSDHADLVAMWQKWQWC